MKQLFEQGSKTEPWLPVRIMHFAPKKVKVSIRLRPSVEGEEVWSSSENTIYAMHKDKQVSYSGFKTVLSSMTNAEVYEACVKEEIQKFLNAENCTVFAYGQTGAGKTYTMLGGEEEGIIKLATRDILNKRSVGISYLEVYNEKLFDLSSNNEVQMFSVGNRNVVSNLWVENVNRWEEVVLFIERCERNRRFGTTEFNTKSSRSHTVFQVTYNDDDKTRTLNMIDLARSERASRSTDRRKEGSFINKSLLALCTVVNNIGYGKYTGFRDSKLTRILQPSLDGYTNLVAICMLSPYPNCMEESISTLKFAARLSNLELKTKEVPLAPETKKEVCRCEQKISNDAHSRGAETSPSDEMKQGCYTGLFQETKLNIEKMSYKSEDANPSSEDPKMPEAIPEKLDGSALALFLDPSLDEESLSRENAAEKLRENKSTDINPSCLKASELSVIKPFKAIESAIINSLQYKTRILEELNVMNEDRISSLEKMITDMLCRNPSRKMNEIFILEKHMFNLRKGMIGKK